MDGLRRHDDRHEPGRIEATFMVFSALVVVALFGFTIFQAVAAPSEPVLTVHVIDVEQKKDETLVTVELRNDGASGWRAVTIEVACDKPAPSATLEQVPAGGARSATLSCPAGTTSPKAAISSRVPT